MALERAAQGIQSGAPEPGRTPRDYHTEGRVGVLDSEAYSVLVHSGLQRQDSFLSFFFFIIIFFLVCCL